MTFRYAIVLSAAFLTGCGDLYSLHPLFTKNDLAFDPAIEGRWESNDDVLTVKRRADLYEAELQSKLDSTRKSKYHVHLTDAGGVRFADLRPDETIGHMFARVRVTPSELRLTFLDSKWLIERVPHEESELEDETIAVLTVS